MIVPGIQDISMVRCSDLPADMSLLSLTGFPIDIGTVTAARLKLHGDAVLRYSLTNANSAEECSLTFRVERPLRWDYPAAFLVTLPDGTKCAVGTREECPETEQSVSTDMPGKASGVSVTVRMRSVRTPVWVSGTPEVYVIPDTQTGGGGTGGDPLSVEPLVLATPPECAAALADLQDTIATLPEEEQTTGGAWTNT